MAQVKEDAFDSIRARFDMCESIPTRTLRPSSRPLLNITRTKNFINMVNELSVFLRLTLGTVFQRIFNWHAANCF